MKRRATDAAAATNLPVPQSSISKEEEESRGENVNTEDIHDVNKLNNNVVWCLRAQTRPVMKKRRRRRR